jgi:hypothetical protein
MTELITPADAEQAGYRASSRETTPGHWVATLAERHEDGLRIYGHGETRSVALASALETLNSSLKFRPTRRPVAQRVRTSSKAS